MHSTCMSRLNSRRFFYTNFLCYYKFIIIIIIIIIIIVFGKPGYFSSKC